MGYQYYIDSLCPKCGTPAWYGRSEHSGIEFHIEHSICYSCAELEAESKLKNRKPPNGQNSFTKMTGTQYAKGEVDDPPDPMEAIRFVK